jgi:hypothetical protein
MHNSSIFFLWKDAATAHASNSEGKDDKQEAYVTDTRYNSGTDHTNIHKTTGAEYRENAHKVEEISGDFAEISTEDQLAGSTGSDLVPVVQSDSGSENNNGWEGGEGSGMGGRQTHN